MYKNETEPISNSEEAGIRNFIIDVGFQYKVKFLYFILKFWEIILCIHNIEYRTNAVRQNYNIVYV